MVKLMMEDEYVNVDVVNDTYCIVVDVDVILMMLNGMC